AKLGNRSISKEELMQLGERLSDLMLPPRVREIFKNSLQIVQQRGQGLRLRLSLESLRLSALPWEYMLLKRTPGETVPGDFVVLQRDVSITRFENLGEPEVALTEKAKMRVVVVLASPTNLESPNQLPVLDLTADEKAITTAIGYLQTKSQSVESVVVTSATR